MDTSKIAFENRLRGRSLPNCPPPLMRSKPPGDEVSRSYQLIYEKYRRDYGTNEFLALKVLARTLGKLA